MDYELGVILNQIIQRLDRTVATLEIATSEIMKLRENVAQEQEEDENGNTTEETGDKERTRSKN